MANLWPNAAPIPTQLCNNPNDKTKYKTQHINETSALATTISECLWARNYPDLQKACFLARICLTRPPQQCQFHNIASILQVGPTCGLTALSMLLGGVPATEELLQLAQRKQFTNNGEMFSAQNLFQLICDNTSSIQQKPPNNSSTNINQQLRCQMHYGELNCEKIKQSLIRGACLFVPYPFQNKNEQ